MVSQSDPPLTSSLPWLADRLPERCSDPKTARTDRECRPVSDFVAAMNENLRELLRAGKLGWQGTEKVLVLSDDTSEHFKLVRTTPVTATH